MSLLTTRKMKKPSNEFITTMKGEAERIMLLIAPHMTDMGSNDASFDCTLVHPLTKEKYSITLSVLKP